MPWWAWLIAGAMAGASIGVVMAAICMAAKCGDDRVAPDPEGMDARTEA